MKQDWRTHRYSHASLQPQTRSAGCLLSVTWRLITYQWRKPLKVNRFENPWCMVYMMWMWEGVCQTSWSLETRCKEHTRHLFLGQPENVAVAERIMGTGQHEIQQHLRMAKVEGCVDCLVKEVIEVQLCPMNFNRDGRFMLSRTRQLLLQQVWNTSSGNWDQTQYYFTPFPRLKRTVITIIISTTMTAYTVLLFSEAASHVFCVFGVWWDLCNHMC